MLEQSAFYLVLFYFSHSKSIRFIICVAINNYNPAKMLTLSQLSKPSPHPLTTPSFTLLKPYKTQQLRQRPLHQIYITQKQQLISYMETDSLEEVKAIDHLYKIGGILNYQGCLFRSKDNVYVIFYRIHKWVCLEEVIDRKLGGWGGERVWVQYLQSFIKIFMELQKQGQYFKIINPSIIGVRNPQSTDNLGFGLLLPFPCQFFNCILKHEYEENIRFVAPQIIRFFSAHPTEEVCQKQFRKAGLFSLGLVLLRCFGYVFTPKQRIEAARNDKQFRNILKKIRKQIKLLHQGKYIPKVLKLLLQDCQKSRQILQTLTIKLSSAQFESLKIDKTILITQLKFISTVSDENKSQINKSQKTINISINQNNTSPLILTPISGFNGAARLQDQGREYGGMNSPVHIEIQDTPTEVWKFNCLHQRIDKQQQLQQPQQPQKPLSEPLPVPISIPPPDIPDIIEYNANQMKIGHHRSSQLSSSLQMKNNNKMVHINQNSIFFDQIDHDEQFDQKSILRRKFQCQSKIIIGLVLTSFFLYGLVGYWRQNY